VTDEMDGVNGLHAELRALAVTVKDMAANVVELGKDMSHLTGQLSVRCPAEEARVSVMATDFVALRTKVDTHCQLLGHESTLAEVGKLELALQGMTAELDKRSSVLNNRMLWFFAMVVLAGGGAFIAHMLIK